MQRGFDQGYAATKKWAEAARAFPAETTTLASVKRQLAHGASLEVDGWRDYSEGLRAKNSSRMEHGDTVLTEADKVMRRAAVAGEKYYVELGGEKAFSGRSDFDHVVTLITKMRSANK